MISILRHPHTSSCLIPLLPSHDVGGRPVYQACPRLHPPSNLSSSPSSSISRLQLGTWRLVDEHSVSGISFSLSVIVVWSCECLSRSSISRQILFQLGTWRLVDERSHCGLPASNCSEVRVLSVYLALGSWWMKVPNRVARQDKRVKRLSAGNMDDLGKGVWYIVIDALIS